MLSLTAEGSKPRTIVNEIARDSEDFLGEKIEISPKTIPRVVKKQVNALLLFERLVELPHISDLWIIDDAFARLPFKGGEHRKHWSPIILDLRTRYCLASCLFPNRDEDITIETLKAAIQHAKRVPSQIMCDDYEAQINGIRRLLPLAEIDAKSKGENYGHINEIESFISLVRGLGISRRGHRSFTNLQAKLELVRFYYNFLRPHGSLGGETPASLAGVLYPKTFRWEKFLRFVRWYINSRGGTTKPSGD
jgi:hypothetical protein